MRHATITAETLYDLDACSEQVELFRETFPTGATPTLANCKKAASAGLDLDWAAENLLTAPASKAYEEATARAWKAYKEATATAFYSAAKAGGLR